MRRIAFSLLLLILPATAQAGTPFPGGLLDSTGRTAYLATGEGIAAVDLTTGTVRWRSAEANHPLEVIGDRLHALATTKAGRLFVRGFDLKERGQRVSESEPIELPRWAVPENGPGRSFAFHHRRDRSRLELTWRIAAWSDSAPRKSTAGSATVELGDGKVAQKEGKADEQEEAVPACLEKLSVRWQRREGGQLRAVVLEELPGSSAFLRRQALVLRRWDESANRELSSRELFRGRDPVLLPDVDAKHLWMRDSTTSADVEGKMRREWVVVSAADGKEVARPAFVAGTLAATIHGGRAYYLTVSSVRTVPGKVSSKGRALVAVELDGGKTVWKLAVEGK